MNARMIGFVLCALFAIEAPLSACTAFVLARRGVVLAANNEDWTSKDRRIAFHPAKDGEFGRFYLGFADGFPQGGMNDQGLFFDGFAIEASGRKVEAGVKVYPGNVMDTVMKCCATVAEAVKWFEEYDLGTDTGMYIIGDATGDAALIERGAIVRKDAKSDFLISTNFRQSVTPGTDATCPRYRAVRTTIDVSAKATPELCARALSGAKQKITTYSNVCDLKERKVHVWIDGDFDHAITFELAEELAKGEATHDLATFFAEQSGKKTDGKKEKRDV